MPAILGTFAGLIATILLLVGNLPFGVLLGLVAVCFLNAEEN